jgi:hypothetical protein
MTRAEDEARDDLVDHRAPSEVDSRGPVPRRWPARSALIIGLAFLLCGAALVVVAAKGHPAPVASLAAPASSATDPANVAGLAEESLPPPAIEITDKPQLVSQVAPPPESPIHAIRRDCPINAPLSDGRSLWIFCDTSMFGPDGKLSAFSNTSAAFAEHDSPIVLHEPLDAEGKPYRFITPTSDYNPCLWGENRFLWPSAAITIHLPDGRDRVLVYYQSLCAAPGKGMVHEMFKDMGVAEYLYDPAHRPGPDEPIQGRIINEQIFGHPDDGDSGFGQAAVLQGGLLYVYRCTPDGACYVGRVNPADATSSGAYTFWDGQDWVADEKAAGELEMPNRTFAMKPSVNYFPMSRLFVMVDTEELHTGVIAVRVARSPQGPWSEPALLIPPGCEHKFPQQCFGVEVHENMSDASAISITFYNPSIKLGESPVQGMRVPVRIVPRRS